MNLISNFAGQGIPSPALIANEIIRLYGIVHFGLNTWTGQEWGMGDASPELFNPTGFDAGRIVREARSGGLQGIILVCKHHDGFCLWPTATTEYNISRSPFRNGQGDLVGEFADACRAEGLRFGVYISPWDRNSAWYGTSRYQELFQLEEKTSHLEDELAQALKAPFTKYEKKETPEDSKKRGAPLGHPGWFRRKPEQIDKTVDVSLDHCPQCGSGNISPCNHTTEHIQEVRR